MKSKRAKTAWIAMLALLVAAPAARAQSIWKSGGAARASYYADSTARQVGDILSVVIQESQVIQNNESTSMEKETSLNTALTNFDIKPNAFNTLPQVTGSSSNTFDGSATYNKNGRFETSISVTVIDVLPNRNLVIEGSRDIQMDREKKRIRISGIVRPRDISPSNRVSSVNVAQARICYEGKGPLTRSTNRSWLDRVLNFLWPF